MNSTQKRHRAPFQPVNTLSSPQKPSYKLPQVTAGGVDDDSAFFAEQHSATSLGDSSGLFDENSFHSSPLPAKPQQQPARIYTEQRPPHKMVREREPPAAQLPPRAAPDAVPKPVEQLQSSAPQFGEASPLRNPLKQARGSDGYSHLFNKPKQGQRRPEHFHAPPKAPPPAAAHTSTTQQRAPMQSYDAFDTLNRPFKVPSMQSGPRYSSASSTMSDFVEIPAYQFQPRPSQGVPVQRPSNAPSHTTFPPQRPMYSSMGAQNDFQSVNRSIHNPLQPARQTIILDDEDDFDPDAEIRAEGNKFGAPDMEAYVDAGKASENIKALLEGAFDGDEKIPRLRIRKKKQEPSGAAGSLAGRLQALDVKDDEAASDAEAENDQEEDDGTVEGLKIKLLPHQVEGVAWMIEKETGNHNKRAKLPKGGILADDMGLGKTVQSLALILSNPRPEKGEQPENKKNKIMDSTGRGTLVVAPLALIKQWEEEINSKVAKSHALKVLVHHGPSRTKSADKLKQYDVIITTYQVLASEHAGCTDTIKKGCFGVNWYRMMVDEAHTIKNRNAKMTKACYEVKSHYRWCLTGTPMQNNLDELQSLIKFLRIQPYCQMASWKESISGPMKNGRGNLAMRRLQIFLKAFMKRRTKDVLKKDGALNFGGKPKDGEARPEFKIVARNVETVIGEFTHAERTFYDRLSERAQSRLDEMMSGEKQDYIGALVLLLRLRQACNHPDLTKSNMKQDKDALTTGSKSNTQTGLQTPRKGASDAADELADLLGGLSVAVKRCDICQNSLTSGNTGAGGVRCTDCENDLNMSVKKSKKKHKKKSRKHRYNGDKKEKIIKVDDSSDEDEVVKPKPTKKLDLSRQRRLIVDSDDEEGEGEWLVSEDQQHQQDSGKAGGTDDEDAEGGGDTLASVDSEASGSEDGSKTNLDSFIVHDTDSEDDAPVIEKKLSKKPQCVVDSDTDTDTDSSSESDSEADREESDTGESDIEYDSSKLIPSTKIRQLLQILETETPGHKVIVFSQFTSMLNLIEPFLDRQGYNYVRYDGGMRNDMREASLAKLRNDKHTRVLLCSLKCGSLGLNLTAASRVVIMEPFWNPFVEEQAIDRVHRLNQTVDVTVYRLSIHNSVEERILELQEAKRKLANAAIEGGAAIGKLGMKEILALFKRDAEFEPANFDHPNDELGTSRGGVRAVLGSTTDNDGESTGPRRAPRKAGSLGFKKDHSVYGRR